MTKAMRLDTYLCTHSVEEFLSLPETQVQDDVAREIQAFDELLHIADSLTLFHDQNNEPYVFFEDEHETANVYSAVVKEKLSLLYYRSTNEPVPDKALKDVLRILSARAKYEDDSQQIELFVRAAQKDDAIYYDLGEGNAARITSTGWKVDRAPILFKRYLHQQRQVMPHSGDPWKLFDFVNVPKEQQLLVLVTIISTIIPGIPHPILHPYGSQGSGKSSLFKIIKKLCDPSSIDLLVTPSDKKETSQILSHHYVCLFDNMSDLPPWLSDVLAMASTGAALSKRRLHTDEDDVFLQFKGCVGINGINTLINRPDLMDRAILLQLRRIESSVRREEKELWSSFETERPKILGGMFDALSRAMAIYPAVELNKKPRLADFARWGYAIAEALGKSGEEFIASYLLNIKMQQEEIVQESLLAQAVLKFMENRLQYDGTVKQCYDELSKLVETDKRHHSWPKHPNQLRKALQVIEVNLLEYGIRFSVEDGHRRQGVVIHFSRETNESASQTSTSSTDADNK
jgi:hypothetical protein